MGVLICGTYPSSLSQLEHTRQKVDVHFRMHGPNLWVVCMSCLYFTVKFQELQVIHVPSAICYHVVFQWIHVQACLSACMLQKFKCCKLINQKMEQVGIQKFVPCPPIFTHTKKEKKVFYVAVVLLALDLCSSFLYELCYIVVIFISLRRPKYKLKKDLHLTAQNQS